MAVEASVARREAVALRAGVSRRQLRDLGEALLYLAPSLVLFAAFVFIPLLRSGWLSTFYTNPIGNPTTFAGLDHYLELFKSATFRGGLLATFLFILFSVPPAIAVSAAVGSLIWLLLLNPSLGLLNYALGVVRIQGPQWMTDPNVAIIAVA